MACYPLKLFCCGGKDDEPSTCPRTELVMHGAITGMQVGAPIGALYGVVRHLSEGGRDRRCLEASAYEYAKQGMLVGGALGSAYTAVRTSCNSDDKDVQAQVSKLNREKCFIDRISLVGAAVGAGGAAYVGDCIGKGAMFGFACATVIGTVVTKCSSG